MKTLECRRNSDNNTLGKLLNDKGAMYDEVRGIAYENQRLDGQHREGRRHGREADERSGA